MKLYLDEQYPPGLKKILTQMHASQSPNEYEIIHRGWQADYDKNDTIVFLMNFNKKAISNNALDYFKEGYRVFIYRKPYQEGFAFFDFYLTMLSHWRKILKTIKKEDEPWIYSISDRNLVKLK